MDYESLYQLIEQRKRELPPDSSTTRLMIEGLPRILSKFNEECFEVGLALESQGADDVALEVSQSFYYLISLMVFMAQPFNTLDLRPCEDSFENSHELAKTISRSSALLCHSPCLETINRLTGLLLKALAVAGTDEAAMFKYL